MEAAAWQHLLTFEREWTDQADGRTLPSFVTDELHDFLGCGILARGLAQLFCPTCQQEDKSPRSLPLSHYISWSDLLRRTFQIDTTCPACKSPLRLIALIKTDDTIKKILSAMGLPCSFGA
jgi:hypothetical protein